MEPSQPVPNGEEKLGYACSGCAVMLLGGALFAYGGACTLMERHETLPNGMERMVGVSPLIVFPLLIAGFVVFLQGLTLFSKVFRHKEPKS